MGMGRDSMLMAATTPTASYEWTMIMERRRRVSLSDVARAAGVSTSAASFALNSRPGVSDTVRERVKEAAVQLGYVPWVSGVALRTGRSGAVGLLIRNLRNPFFLDVINGFDATCAEAGLGVVIGSADYAPSRESELLSTFIAREVDGLALAPIGGGSAAVRWHDATAKPIVFINAAQHALDIDASRVHVDGEGAVRQAVTHLVGLGHSRIALVAAPKERSADSERARCFLALQDELAFEARIISSEMRHDRAVEVLRSVFEEPSVMRPTGIITSSDYLATAVYSAASEIGLRVGVDVSVVGHDDLATSRFLAPSLTSIAVDRYSLGVAAACALIHQLGGAGTSTVVVPTTLIARQSSGPPSPQPT